MSSAKVNSLLTTSLSALCEAAFISNPVATSGAYSSLWEMGCKMAGFKTQVFKNIKNSVQAIHTVEWSGENFRCCSVGGKTLQESLAWRSLG